MYSVTLKTLNVI